LGIFGNGIQDGKSFFRRGFAKGVIRTNEYEFVRMAGKFAAIQNRGQMVAVGRRKNMVEGKSCRRPEEIAFQITYVEAFLDLFQKFRNGCDKSARA
jgi:hypothetical protein